MEIFFNAANPLLFIISVVAFIVIVIYYSATRIFIPLRRMHEKEKLFLEMKNEKLLGLFASSNPSPLFRFNEKGSILSFNKAGEEILSGFAPQMDNIKLLLPHLKDINIGSKITSESDYFFTEVINGRSYEVVLKGLPEYGFGHAYCYDITDRLKFEAELIDRQNKLRELAVFVQDANESTRNAIAMELHDGVCQTISTLKMSLENMRELVQANSKAKLLNDDILRTTESVLGEIKSLSYHLTPKFLQEFGLIEAIKALIVQSQVGGKIKGTFQIFGDMVAINPKMEINIYRIFQEILANINKHSKAKNYLVQIFVRDKTFNLTVEDDGIGFEVDSQKQAGNLGLLNITERVTYFNGTCTITSTPEKGTEFIITLPIN